MIQRRQFIGATAAATLFAARPAFALTTPAAAVPPAPAFDWECREIRTIKDDAATRRPIITGISLQNEGNLIALVGDDHMINLYDFRTGDFVSRLRKHRDWVRAAAFSADSNSLFTCANDKKLIRWGIEGNTATPETLATQPSAIINLAINNAGTRIATVGHNENAFLYDNVGRRITTFRCSCDDNHAVAFSSDDSLLAIGGRNGTIRVFDVTSGLLKHELKSHRRRIRGLEFISEDELISAGDDQIVKMNHLGDRSKSIALPRMATKLYAVQSVGPGLIATSGSDNKIHIWDLISQSQVGILRGHTGTVTCMDMSQGLFVSGSYDATIRIWTPKPNEVANRATSNPPPPPTGSKGWTKSR